MEVVSNDFEGKVSINKLSTRNVDNFKQTTMQRHRIIYSALSEELAAGVHALSLRTKTERDLKGDPMSNHP